MGFLQWDGASSSFPSATKENLSIHYHGRYVDGQSEIFPDWLFVIVFCSGVLQQVRIVGDYKWVKKMSKMCLH